MYANVKHRFTACSTVKTPMEKATHKAPSVDSMTVNLKEIGDTIGGLIVEAQKLKVSKYQDLEVLPMELEDTVVEDYVASPMECYLCGAEIDYGTELCSACVELLNEDY